MARNRRGQTSMKYAIGRACMILFAGVTCVAMSITKVIVGSEYVSSCPSRELIPIFVIVSGCLPVLLSALRQPYDSGHLMDKDKFSMRVSLITALLGVLINLAWLVAGTYVVIKTWNSNLCAHQQFVFSKFPNSSLCTVSTEKNDSLNDSITFITFDNSSQMDFPCLQNDSLRERVHLPTSSLFNESNVIKSSSQIQSSNNLQNKSDSNNLSTENSTVYRNSGSAAIKNSTGDAIGEQEGIKTETLDEQGGTAGHTYSTVETLGQQEGTIIKAESLDQLEDTVTKMMTDGRVAPVDKSCITCDIGILSFSLAVIIVDWLFVLFGSLYFCYFVKYRFASFKDQLLSTNA